MKESSTLKVFMIYYERFSNFLCVFFVRGDTVNSDKSIHQWKYLTEITLQQIRQSRGTLVVNPTMYFCQELLTLSQSSL